MIIGILFIVGPMIGDILLQQAQEQAERYHVIENALFALIGIGHEEVIEIVINKLNESGTKTMAEVYLNSGHQLLSEAAREWAKQHGFTINVGTGSHPISW